MNVFISGSISISKLPPSAVKKIDSIINNNFTILIGDAKGVDLQVQKYLYEKNYDNVIVYFVGLESRNNIGNWKTKKIADENNRKGRELFTLKDIAMAEDADYGLMIWDGKSPGTLNNIKEMKNRNKRFFVIYKETVIDEKNTDLLISRNEKKKIANKSQLALFNILPCPVLD
jgi:hypothetical protein